MNSFDMIVRDLQELYTTALWLFLLPYVILVCVISWQVAGYVQNRRHRK